LDSKVEDKIQRRMIASISWLQIAWSNLTTVLQQTVLLPTVQFCFYGDE
jgi:hypothetical protein